MISVFGSSMGELEKKAVAECLDSQWIGFGKKVEEFEQQLTKFRNFKNFTMLDSGSNSLFLALKLLNLPTGTEVVLPAYTWVSCASAVLLAGLVPVFCDVEVDSMNVSISTISKVLSKNTGCIMVVHFAGLPVDIDPILELGIPVIEDAAHAIYSDYKNKPCGTFGDIGVFSFDAVKNLAVGEGGGITTKNQNHEEQAKNFRYCGIKKSGFESASKSLREKYSQSNMWWQ